MRSFLLGVFLGLSLFYLYQNSTASAHERTVPSFRYKYITSATIYNPTIWSADLLLKCDWDGRVWRNVKKYKLKGHSDVTIKVPNGSRCQIWPSL
jgi:hypothetical protein